jgi:acetolactate synthase-1/2/3 large subunit
MMSQELKEKSVTAQQTYTAADSMMEALHEAGVDYIFANLGSDHPAIIESWAKFSESGRTMPDIIICPHEAVALSAAQGYAQVTGKSQAVFVHVDVGTQNLGGNVHNASRGKVPVLIFSGASPFTMEGEETGSRNESIHFWQDVFDQRGIVREYTKWDYEIRSGKNMKQLIYRAIQIAESDPKGPVYLMAAREVLEEIVGENKTSVKGWGPISPSGLSQEDCNHLIQALSRSDNPLILTSSLGRNTKAVEQLVKLTERLAIPVLEISPNYLNFPTDHPMHLGFTRNSPLIAEADVIVVIDCDIPWVTTQVRPNDNCSVFYLDTDPLKENIPLWYIPSEKFYRVDSYLALSQLNECLDQTQIADRQKIEQRYKRISQKHEQLQQERKAKETINSNGVITAEYLTACIREIIDDNTIVLNEAISNSGKVFEHLQLTKPGTLLGSGGSSLGWHGGAAIGVKLAAPDKTVISLTGDGTYIFSCPTAVHWVARKYNTPFLTVIYNNQGWNSPKLSTLGVHPKGVASKYDQFWVNFDPCSELDKVAEAAGGAFARSVTRPEDLKNALTEGLNAVHQGRSAVINVYLAPVSQPKI